MTIQKFQPIGPTRALELSVTGSMRIFYDPKGDMWQDALNSYRTEVDRTADSKDLAGYICTVVLETGMQNPSKVSGMPPVTVLHGRDKVPVPFPWCVVVLPTINIDA
jgi:hypothetical protein